MVFLAAAAALGSAMSRFRREFLSLEFGTLSLVYAMFALPEITQLDDLVLLQSGRQRGTHHVNPRPTVSGCKEPVVFVEVVVAPADEVDVVGDADCNKHAGFRKIEHGRTSLHDNGRRGADIDIDIHLGERRSRKDGVQKHHAKHQAESIRSYTDESSSHEVTPFSPVNARTTTSGHARPVP